MTQAERLRVGATLRVLRQAANLKQTELAKACAVTRQHIHNVEAGAKPIGHRLADVIAAVLAPRIRSTEKDIRRLLSPPGKEK